MAQSFGEVPNCFGQDQVFIPDKNWNHMQVCILEERESTLYISDKGWFSVKRCYRRNVPEFKSRMTKNLFEGM